MKISNIRSAEKRAIYFARFKKSIAGLFKSRRETKPVFIAGLQRSGTDMLVNALYLHSDVEVFDESKSSIVFEDYRIRNESVLSSTIERCQFDFVCYKIISDSHRVPAILRRFPDAKVVWAYRSFGDNADSQLKKFPHATRAIRLACEGKKGGGWFTEGLSDDVRATLRGLDWIEYSEFDYACLVWWARNKSYFELGLADDKRVRTVKYDAIVNDANETLKVVQQWLCIPWDEDTARFIHQRSVAKPNLPELHPQVSTLCESLEEKLDEVSGVHQLDRQTELRG